MNTLASEYEKDFHNWIEQHIHLLKTGQVHQLDTAHLIEELEGMANRDRNELVSHLVILIAHLLKWQFQLATLAERWKEFEGKSWRKSIIEQRYRVQDQLDNIPSLKKDLEGAVVKAYPKAVSLAAKETGFSPKTFPKECPYSIQHLLDDDFYPNLERNHDDR
jgi:hypothetical protein